jgi:hypothetical protein
VWSGSLFDCAGGEILLRHSQFSNSGSAIVGECNNGAVVAQSIGVNVDTNNSHSVRECYSSQLNISTNMAMNNKTVVCTHIDGIDISVIDTSTITFITGTPCYPM